MWQLKNSNCDINKMTVVTEVVLMTSFSKNTLTPWQPTTLRAAVGNSCDVWIRTYLIWAPRGNPALHTEHCTLHTAHCTLHTAHCTLHTAHCTLHTAHCTLHTTHYTLHTTHYTLHITHYTLHITHYTIHTTHCII